MLRCAIRLWLIRPRLRKSEKSIRSKPRCGSEGAARKPTRRLLDPEEEEEGVVEDGARVVAEGVSRTRLLLEMLLPLLRWLSSS